MVRPVCLCVIRALLLTRWGDPAGALLSINRPDSGPQPLPPLDARWDAAGPTASLPSRPCLVGGS